MSLVIETDPNPLRIDKDGAVRVGSTRVTLDTVVTAYQLGSTAEEIVQQFPTVSLPDVHAVLSFYLRHRAEVEAYLEEGRRQAEALRKEYESRSDLQGIRERLLARRAGQR